VSAGTSGRFRFNPADLDGDFSLDDTVAPRGSPSSEHSTARPVVGYNPYDRKAGAAPPAPEPNRRPTDLRKLSEWIRLQRELETLKKNRSD
jgi:hypothetical protein